GCQGRAELAVHAEDAAKLVAEADGYDLARLLVFAGAGDRVEQGSDGTADAANVAGGKPEQPAQNIAHAADILEKVDRIAQLIIVDAQHLLSLPLSVDLVAHLDLQAVPLVEQVDLALQFVT